MWIYEKRLLYPVNVKRPNPRMAKLLLAQYGGPNSEMSASINYLNQRYSMPNDYCKSLLTDIGTEELAHVEMIGAMITQCLKNANRNEIAAAGMDGWYVMHRKGAFPCSPSGEPWTASYTDCTGDPIADLTNDMAAEQKARAAYEGLMNMCDDPDLITPLQFLRQREIVHFQRFGEALDMVQSEMNKKKCY